MVRTGGRRYKKILRKFLKWLSLLAFLASVGMIIKLIFLDPKVVTRDQDEVKSIYYNQENGENFDDKFKKLAEINSDIKAWIFISGTVIDYPVLQREGNPDYYLFHNYKGERSRYGSIFVGGDCKIDSNCKNIVLHGHNMRDGQMFAGILKFLDLDFYKQNPVVEFDTPLEKGDYKVFSAFKTNISPEQGYVFNYLIPNFDSAESFENFVNEVKKRSYLEIPVDVNKDDNLLTLSTCSNDAADTRTVVVARKLREGEDRFVDVESAKYVGNKEPLRVSHFA